MVSETDFDKNQKAYRELINNTAPAQANTTQPAAGSQQDANMDVLQQLQASGNAISDFFDVRADQRTSAGLPDLPAIISGVSSDEVTPQDRLWLGAGIANAPASRAVYNALIKIGLSKSAAAKGAAQAAQMVKNGVSFEIAADKAAMWTALRTLPKTAENKALASRAGFDAVNLLKQGTTPTTQGLGKILSEAGELLKTPQGIVLAGGTAILGGIVSRIAGDYSKGLLGLDEAGAQTAKEFYAAGRISKDQLHQELDGRGYSDPIIKAHEEDAEDMLTRVTIAEELGPTLGVVKLDSEDTTSYTNRVYGQMKTLQQQAFDEANAVQTEEQIIAESARGGEKKQFLETVSSKPEAGEQRFVSPGAKDLQKRLLKEGQKQPVAAINTDTQSVSPASAPGGANFTPAPNFTPRFKTKAELQNEIGASVTEEAWQRYLRTGQI